jgi:hypothetical protein
MPILTLDALAASGIHDLPIPRSYPWSGAMGILRRIPSPMSAFDPAPVRSFAIGTAEIRF